jgi:hypothetical protein
MDLPALLSDWFGLPDPEMQRAAVAGLLQMAGIFVTGLIAIVTFSLTQRATRRRDARLQQAAIERERALREERIQDMQTALLADIKSYPHRVLGSDLDHHFQHICGQIEAAPPSDPFTPFVPREPPTQLWTLVAKEVHLLPAAVIDPVVSFYTQVEAIRLFADDLRSARFARLSTSRKIAMYRDYIELKKYAAKLAEDAVQALLHALDLRPNSQEPVRSARKQASEAVASEYSGDVGQA